MELQQELLWKIVERELGTGLISCEPLNAGGSADVYRATVKGEPHTACIKLFRSEGAAGMARQEAEQIALLAQYSIIPFPRLYFVHDATPEEPLEALGMELMPGVSALNKTFYWKSPAKRRRMSDLSVDSLIRIHSAENDRFGPLDTPDCPTWNDFYYPLAKEILEKAQKAVQDGRFRAETCETMEKAFRRYEDIFGEEIRQAVLIHGDYWPANILIDPKSLLPQAVIDPYNSMWADREYELFALNNVMGSCFRLYENYKSKVKLSRLCDLKCAFYALYSEVRWFHQLGEGSHPFMWTLAKRLKRQMKRFSLG